MLYLEILKLIICFEIHAKSKVNSEITIIVFVINYTLGKLIISLFLNGKFDY